MSERRWLHQAACRNMGTDLFFPLGSTGSALEQAQRAKAVCVDCPVRRQCLEWALTTGQNDGIWGGKTEDERRALRRRRGGR